MRRERAGGGGRAGLGEAPAFPYSDAASLKPCGQRSIQRSAAADDHPQVVAEPPPHPLQHQAVGECVPRPVSERCAAGLLGDGGCPVEEFGGSALLGC